jgi:succinyl-diaminopimelate desuccinylase
MNKINFNPVCLTQALVQCPSITPKDEGALDIIQNHLNSLDFNCTRLPFSDQNSYDVDNLFATIGSTGKHLAFAGHTDVVPPGHEQSWKYPPFSATIENDKLFGRGSEDMKSNIACFISATEEFISKYGKDFKGKLSFIITGDEEGKAINGTPKMMEWTKQNNIVFDHCIVGEPTSNKIIGDKIKIGRRGSINFFITIKGIQGHTANGHRAENPVHYLTKLLNNLIAEPLDHGNEFFLPTAIQIPTFDVGNPAHNIIPEYAKATINIRFNDQHTSDDLINWLQNNIDQIFNNIDRASCSFVTEVSAKSFLNKPGYLSDIMSKSISEVNGKNSNPKLATDGGTSDARFIKNYCEVAELGIRNQTLHQVNEFVYLSDIKELHKIYFRIIENYFVKNQ